MPPLSTSKKVKDKNCFQALKHSNMNNQLAILMFVLKYKHFPPG